MTTPPTLVADPGTDPTAAPAAVAAAISRSHIDRLRQSVSDYAARLAPRVESCRDEYADRSYAVLEWVRFPLEVNLTLRSRARARGITLAPRHERVPRDKRYRVSRAAQADPQVYDGHGAMRIFGARVSGPSPGRLPSRRTLRRP